MSRDWTPKEQYLWDRYIQEKEGRSLRGRFEMVVKNPDGTDGETIRLDNHLEAERYPELSFLYSDFDRFISEYREDDALWAFVSEYLDEAEGALKTAECRMPVPSGLEFVAEWFEGNLDPSFYYREQNNEAFEERLREYIRDEMSKDAVCCRQQSDPLTAGFLEDYVEQELADLEREDV